VVKHRRDYLFPRGTIWWIRFVYPPELRPYFGGKKGMRQSLGTADRRVAEAKAAPMIAKHKLDFLEVRNRHGWKTGDRLIRKVKVAGFEHLYPLGDTVQDDGSRVVATETTAVIFNADGTFREQVRNEIRIVPTFRFDPNEQGKPKPPIKRPPADGDLDEKIIKRWITTAGIKPRVEDDARRAYQRFRTLTDGKTFIEATRDDGRALVAALYADGLLSATVEKVVGYLRAAINIEMEETATKFTSNPFSKVMPKKRPKDATKRVPLDAGDMLAMRNVLPTMSPEDQLLWKWLACTGMRRGEPFQIEGEFLEDAGPGKQTRYVITGSKTDSSIVGCDPGRRRPSPTRPDHGQALQRQPRCSGEADLPQDAVSRDRRPAQGSHSLRHRAIDQLRALQCPEDIRLEIVGHDEKTVHRSYGHGHPVWVTKQWIDKITF
jgi:integrase